VTPDPRKLLLEVEKLSVVEFNNLVELTVLNTAEQITRMKIKAFEAGHDRQVMFLRLAVRYRRYLDLRKQNGFH
jgi:hypothetical protein